MADPGTARLVESEEDPPLIHPEPEILRFVRVEDALLIYQVPHGEKHAAHRYAIDTYAIADQYPAIGAAWSQALETGGCLNCLSEGEIAALVTIYVRPIIETLRRIGEAPQHLHADALVEVSCPGCEQPDEVQGVLWERTSFELPTRAGAHGGQL